MSIGIRAGLVGFGGFGILRFFLIVMGLFVLGF